LSLPPQTSNNAAEERNRKLKERKAKAFTHARSVRKQISSSEDSDAATPRRITAAEKPSLSEDEVCTWPPSETEPFTYVKATNTSARTGKPLKR
jgi:hypothetical protein